jgi:hypothetical protein
MDMATCATCGVDLHPERAEKYSYCTKVACQDANRQGLTIVAVGVNKSADQYQILDDDTREDLASGKHHDPRRATYGQHTPRPAQPSHEVARKADDPAAGRDRRNPASRPRQPWTASQQRLALLYNEQGLRPDEIARKLGVSRYLVTQMILKAPRKRR